MQRYFSDLNKGIFLLNRDDSYHIIKVMRNVVGDKIEIISNGKLYIAKIIEIEKVVIAEPLEEKDEYNELPCHITVAQSLVKEQKMDYIIQKATELGMSELIPLEATRSIVKLDKKEDKKKERWTKIAKEASEQSKRNMIPIISSSKTIDELIKEEYTHKLLCSVNEVSTSVKKVLQNVKEDDKILVVIGPEGGFCESEEDKLISNGFIPVTLGSRVLRTETASLFVLSTINYIFMR